LARDRGGIFISYRREETAPYAGRLYDHLSEHFGEDRVFMDVDSIAIGTDFTKAIIEAVSQCDILLVLIGRHWSAVTDVKGIRRIDYPHDFIRVEIEAALQRDIRVVPVLVDGALLPQADDLPPSLRPIVLRQALELGHTGFRSEVSRLIAAIDDVLDTEPSQPAEPSKLASRGTVTQGKWQLELAYYSRVSALVSKSAFRLSSSKNAHDITIEIRSFKEVIWVDGHREVVAYSDTKPHSLKALSRALGSDVTIEWKKDSPNTYRIKLVILKIGGQIVSYERKSGDG
jgi:TIR domain